MNEIKDIELQILNLGRNPESEKLTKMIDKMDEFVNNKALQHPIYLEFFTEKSGNTPGEPYMGLIRLKAKKFKFQM